MPATNPAPPIPPWTVRVTIPVAQGCAAVWRRPAAFFSIFRKNPQVPAKCAWPCATFPFAKGIEYNPGTVEGRMGGSVQGSNRRQSPGCDGRTRLVAGIVQDQVEVAEAVAHAAVEKTEADERWRTGCDFW